MNYGVKEIGRMEHGELHYVGYGLMINRVKSKEVWTEYIKRVSSLPQVVPMVYYNSLGLQTLSLVLTPCREDLHHFQARIFLPQRLPVHSFRSTHSIPTQH